MKIIKYEDYINTYAKLGDSLVEWLCISNFKLHECFGAIVIAVVIFRYPMARPGRFHAAHTQQAASLRLLSQPAWNDVGGWRRYWIEK